MRAEIYSLLKLAIPIMGAQFLSLIMVVTDNIIVGHMQDPDSLAGLALAGGFYSLFFIIVIAFVGAISPLVSKAHATQNWTEAGRIARQGLMLSVIVSVALACGLYVAEPLILFTGQDPAASAIAAEYLRVMMWAVPAQLGFLTLRNFSEGCEDSLPSLVIGATTALMNVGLDYALVLGYWNFPAMGVTGAGIATALLSWVSFIALLIYLLVRPAYRKYQLLTAPKPDPAVFKTILKLAIPLAGAIGMEMSFFVATTFLMGRLGVTELAAHQVALNATGLFFMIPLGLSFAVSIRIAAFKGRGDYAGARRSWLASLVIAFVIQGATAIFLITRPDIVVALYAQHGEVEQLALKLLFISGLFQFFDGFQVLGMGALRGLEDVKYAFVATSIAFWVIGITAVLFGYLSGTPEGIWIGLLVGLGSASIAHHTRIFLNFRKTQVA